MSQNKIIEASLTVRLATDIQMDDEAVSELAAERLQSLHCEGLEVLLVHSLSVRATHEHGE